MNNADYAIYFAEKTGLPVFPVRVQSSGGFAAKAPHISAPYDNSTTDPSQIRKWYNDFHCAFAAHPGRKGYTVVDLDTHGGKDGRASLSDWEFSTGCFIPPTLTVRTPSGGEHLWFLGGETELTGGKDGLLDGVDVHGGPGTEGRYVLIPGQQIAAGSYSIENRTTPAKLPKQIAEAVNAARAVRQKKSNAATASPDAAPAGSLDFTDVLNQILTMKPVACGNRDNTLIAMCLDWKERGFTPSNYIAFMRLMAELGKIEQAEDFSDSDFTRLAQSAWKKQSAVFGSSSVAALLPSRDKWLSAKELMRMKLPEKEWLVPKLIPANAIGFLGGNAKSGKTYLCLQLAYALATASPFLGMDIPKKRNVLYVYLEGGVSQVQIRYRELYGHDVEFPDTLSFIFHFPPLDAGGLTQIREAIKRHNADLVIIDTWQRARVDDGRKGLNAYQKEYKEIEILSNEICSVTGCAVLLLHHLKQPGKGQTIDNLNALNGSSALGGASDFVLILNRDRGADTAQMHAHGRDFEDLEMSLVKGDTMFWRRSASDAGSLILTPETESQQQIVRVLRDAPDEGMTAREIATKIPGCNYNSVAVQLKRWADEGKIDKTAKRYRLFDGSEVEE